MTRRDAGFEGPLPDHMDEAVARQDQIFKDTFPGMLGVRILEAGPQRAVATLEVGPSVLHPGGYAHGGAIAGFGDTIAAWATFPHLRPGQSFTTIEFKANFIAGVSGGTLRGESSVVHAGRRTIVILVRITAQGDGRLVALMTVTQAVLAAGDAGGPTLQPEGAEVSPEP